MFVSVCVCVGEWLWVWVWIGVGGRASRSVARCQSLPESLRVRMKPLSQDRVSDVSSGVDYFAGAVLLRAVGSLVAGSNHVKQRLVSTGNTWVNTRKKHGYPLAGGGGRK